MGKTLPKFTPRDMPAFVPYDFSTLQNGAVMADKTAYAFSDNDYRARHPDMKKAEGLFEDSVLADEKGDSLMPQVQNEFMRSGLAGALGSFGDASTAGGTSGGAIAPGSAGEADVARSLGVDIMGYQDRNRKNREASLSLGETLFPRRKIGMSGQDYTLTSMLNTMGQNNWNQADFANKTNSDQINYRGRIDRMNAATGQANANAAGDAQQTSSMTSAGASIAGAAIMALAMSCWVARAAYGAESTAWRIFRRWLLSEAPLVLRRNYLRHGQRFAKVLDRSKWGKALVRGLMNIAVNSARRRWANV